ncbi:MAG: TIGR02466 family protein [Steroidobacteraceae bacterium]
MATRLLFATPLYTAALLRAPAGSTLKARLLRECLQLREDDHAGRAWSRQNYRGGFTSYSSAHRMHERSPVFAELQRRIDPHVSKLARTLAFDLRGRKLTMTDCWVNIMPEQVAHSMHLHPLATISGTYYVKVPPRSAGLKFEDPRLERFMAAPPRKRNLPWYTVPARAGSIVLFESWLRHEVPANQSRGERISVSFNYGWF